ncbi:LOW QUALITY PROTEIN: attractin-like protein 1 [Lepeophtheirus salmonis]|uniref:LOW QUALITY PROTEIN: attractin-like protein 1 n=1 Tax=Lepeophtheirus salmonis TaxID=72036 RepID=UPI003AF398AD
MWGSEWKVLSLCFLCVWTEVGGESCGGDKKGLRGASKGWLSDGVGNYSETSHCTWVISGPERSASKNIRLHLKEFATECGWDHLYVYDGDSVFSPLLGVFSGLTRLGRYKVRSIPEVVATSGSMLIHFYSDVAYNASGFNLTYAIDACPSLKHDLTCSGHGTCSDGICQCDDDFKGEACSVPSCPKNCVYNGSRRGTCNKEKKRCDCFEGYVGESCSQSLASGYWKKLSFSDPMPPRSSHASVLSDDNKIWIIGGETFSHPRHILSYIKSSGTNQLEWKRVHFEGEKAPSPRYGHTAVIHDNRIYMYGGTMRSGHISKEIWSFHLQTYRWERISTTKGPCMNSGINALCGPLHITGHTATVIENRMIVIFGHSPTYGYLDIVQEYHFFNNEWQIVETHGYPVRGGFGHSAAYDPVTKLIYVYGGYVSTGWNSATLSQDLYSYDNIDKKWKLHQPSNSFRYLHSSVISQGLMIIYGGNTHNDTSWSHGAKCFSSDLLAYDIACDHWFSMDDSFPTDFDVDLPRLGHTATMVNKSMAILGGFDGVLKKDLFMYVPGKCQTAKTRSDCLNYKPGVKCIWNKRKEFCEPHPSHLLPSSKLSSSVDVCQIDEHHTNSLSGFCSKLSSCSACLSTSVDCVWCRDGCSYKFCKRPSSTDSLEEFNRGTAILDHLSKNYLIRRCSEAISKGTCNRLHTCHSCQAHSLCQWVTGKSSSKCKEKKKTSIGNLTEEPDFMNKCFDSCNKLDSCSNCTAKQCMWCHNLGLCVDRNAYLSAFPYGQCMDWTTTKDGCPKNDSLPICADYQTCTSCRSNPACGWCDDGSRTGLGSCHIGGASGPLKLKEKRENHWALDNDICPASKGKQWHFTSCPNCQCNGHSKCSTKEKVCDDCLNHTTGEHCQKCTKGYFGNPVNGGKCRPCKCNEQAEECDHRTGKCLCSTKGIIGDQCEKCDKVNHYLGNPVSGSCFYNLTIDYQFTFNLSKPEDHHYRAINFKNIPTKADTDVEFSIECSVPAKMDLAYRQTKPDGEESEEMKLFANYNCSEKFKSRYSKTEFSFGSEVNTTFYVYVYEFQPPLIIVVSFSQYGKLNLLQFFITFSICFLGLLLGAAILWKIKQKYDRYRRRQRLFVEMEQMASRPFGSVLIDMERLPDMSSMPDDTSSTHIRKRRKRSWPSPIALEPCVGNRAAILSLIVRLPTGGKPYAPNGYTGIAVASSLVTLGNPRKPSSDIPNRQALDEHTKIGRKFRKTGSSDTVGGNNEIVVSGNTRSGMGLISQPTDL